MPSLSLRTGASLWLKVLVIAMGLVIVAGFVVVAAEVARRMSGASLSSANGLSSPVANAAFTQRIALPSGAQVLSMEPVADRLVVHVKTADGQSTAYFIDPRNGALLGTVAFPPGTAR